MVKEQQKKKRVQAGNKSAFNDTILTYLYNIQNVIFRGSGYEIY